MFERGALGGSVTPACPPQILERPSTRLRCGRWGRQLFLINSMLANRHRWSCCCGETGCRS
eukprot:862494-Lingulodinium_polyedra.AAC.1